MLEIKELIKYYGSNLALDKINLAFAPGEIVGLFGENGAGKTTEALDQEGTELVPWMKQLYGYDNRAAELIERAERDSK